MIGHRYTRIKARINTDLNKPDKHKLIYSGSVLIGADLWLIFPGRLIKRNIDSLR